ncbi:hypothetical protein ACXR0O_22815 [Verrucomicrobiota bacterium sgz303538]
MELNGYSFSAQQGMMSADGSEYFLTSGDLNGIIVSRRIKIETKDALVRYFETFRNTASNPQTVNVNLHIQFNNQMQAITSDSGSANFTALGAKDCGFVAMRRGNQSAPSAAFMIAGPGGKIRPTISNNQNYRVTVTYPLTIAPGEAVSIVHAAAQRTLTGGTDSKSLAKLFAPLKSPRLLTDVPAADRKSLANFRAGSANPASQLPAFSSLFDKLNIQPGPSDLLAIGAETRLKGTASCAGLQIETQRGTTEVAIEKVAAVLGGRREAHVLLRDGQVLSGKLAAKGLKFTLTTGTAMDLDVGALDRLVFRASPSDSQLAAGAWGLVETFDGDRLAVKPASGFRLRANTAWGVREISPDELAGCGPTEENPLGFYVGLKDGSRFIALLDGEEISFDTVLFGRQTFRASEIRQISVVQPKPTTDDNSDAAPDHPQVVIAGGQLLNGQIDLAELHFLSPAGVIPVAPNLLKTLHNTSEDEAGESPAFTAELWGGGTVSGVLREAVLPIRCAGAVLQVPVRDVVDALVPSPAMPQGLRDKVARLIRDLGDPDWEKREAASRELGDLGAMARLQLDETVKQSTDAEVRRRAQALLDSIES